MLAKGAYDEAAAKLRQAQSYASRRKAEAAILAEAYAAPARDPQIKLREDEKKNNSSGEINVVLKAQDNLAVLRAIHTLVKAF